MILLVLLLAGLTKAQISMCKDETIRGLRICTNETYDKGKGETQPLFVKEKVLVHDIPEFNQNDKTISIYMTLYVYWNDTRVMLKSSDPSQ